MKVWFECTASITTPPLHAVPPTRPRLNHLVCNSPAHSFHLHSMILLVCLFICVCFFRRATRCCFFPTKTIKFELLLLAVALENVVDVLQHTTATLCILQPPVKIHLSFPAVPSGTRPMDRDGDANTMETMQWKLARELRRSTCATRLLFGLSNEFYSSPSSPSSSPASEGTYIGVSACQTIPRGCRWGCCAGIVLQVRGSSTNQTHPTTRLYAFSSYAAINDTSSLTTHLKKVRWTEYGFKWNTPPLHQQQQQDCFGPLHIQLQCEQPESGAFLPTVVIHLFPTSTPTPTATSSLNTNANNNARLADLHQSILVRRAVDAAFQDLRTKCPGVVCNRRERSLARAVPVVAEVVTNIVMRSSNTELMEHIDPHSMVVGGEGIEEEVERMLREALEDSVVLALTPAAIPATAASVDEEVEGEVEVE